MLSATGSTGVGVTSEVGVVTIGVSGGGRAGSEALESSSAPPLRAGRRHSHRGYASATASAPATVYGRRDRRRADHHLAGRHEERRWHARAHRPDRRIGWILQHRHARQGSGHRPRLAQLVADIHNPLRHQRINILQFTAQSITRKGPTRSPSSACSHTLRPMSPSRRAAAPPCRHIPGRPEAVPASGDSLPHIPSCPHVIGCQAGLGRRRTVSSSRARLHRPASGMPQTARTTQPRRRREHGVSFGISVCSVPPWLSPSSKQFCSCYAILCFNYTRS